MKAPARKSVKITNINEKNLKKRSLWIGKDIKYLQSLTLYKNIVIFYLEKTNDNIIPL